MAKRIKVSSKRLKRIRVSSRAPERLDPTYVAKALGAELVETGVPKPVLPTVGVRGAKGAPSNGKR